MDFNLNGPTGAYEDRVCGEPSLEEQQEADRAIFHEMIRDEASLMIARLRERAEKTFARKCGKLEFGEADQRGVIKPASDAHLIQCVLETLTEYFDLGEYEFNREAE